MFTKLFKKSHDPYELGGRWYKMRISITEHGANVINSDIPETTDQMNIPSTLEYTATADETALKISLANGLLIDYIVDPTAGVFTLDFFGVSVEYNEQFNFYVSNLSLPVGTVSALDLYLYIVER